VADREHVRPGGGRRSWQVGGGGGPVVRVGGESRSSQGNRRQRYRYHTERVARARWGGGRGRQEAFPAVRRPAGRNTVSSLAAYGHGAGEAASPDGVGPGGGPSAANQAIRNRSQLETDSCDFSPLKRVPPVIPKAFTACPSHRRVQRTPRQRHLSPLSTATSPTTMNGDGRQQAVPLFLQHDGKDARRRRDRAQPLAPRAGSPVPRWMDGDGGDKAVSSATWAVAVSRRVRRLLLRRNRRCPPRSSPQERRSAHEGGGGGAAAHPPLHRDGKHAWQQRARRRLCIGGKTSSPKDDSGGDEAAALAASVQAVRVDSGGENLSPAAMVGASGEGSGGGCCLCWCLCGRMGGHSLEGRVARLDEGHVRRGLWGAWRMSKGGRCRRLWLSCW